MHVNVAMAINMSTVALATWLWNNAGLVSVQ